MRVFATEIFADIGFFQIVSNAHAAFRANKTRPIEIRRQNLLNVDRFLTEHKENIIQALQEDLAKVGGEQKDYSLS